MPVGSFFSLLTSEQVAKQFPVMTEAVTQIRAEGLKTAVLSNNFYLSDGQSFLPLDRKQFDVVSLKWSKTIKNSLFLLQDATFNAAL